MAVVEPAGGGQSDEALAVARDLAGRLGTGVDAFRLTEGGTPESWSARVAALVDARSPVAVVAPGTELGNEVMAHLAARTALPLAANCVELTPDGSGPWAVTRVRGGGVLLEEAELDAPAKLLTVAAGAADAAAGGPAGPGEPEAAAAHPEPLPADETGARVRLVDRAAQVEGVTLATAPVVVSGGRGIGGAEGFTVLEELAGLLGGAVGCSRVVTNAGWRPHSDQVGQTGTKVAPDLYIAAGISGATQHWAGCMGSKAILAINTDPEAPMVTRADYAVIGDALEVLGAVTAEIRQRADR